MSDIKWFQNQLLKWFDKVGRHHLPWKKPLSAYRVWLSEIMLQQTQVATVIPYFERFITSFNTVKKLASSPQQEVLSHWAGLGYYARARNLHLTAQIIVKRYQGQFPQTLEALVELPGIGRSTAGAILAQAFDIQACILEGNVRRVLSRYHKVKGTIKDKKFLDILWKLSEQYTPNKRVGDYTQAMMDLGALVCTKSKPQCGLCPVKKHCKAYLTDSQHLFPEKVTKKKIPLRQGFMMVLLNQQGEMLLQKRPERGIWGGLWSLPECEDENSLEHFIASHKIKAKNIRVLTPFIHTFTHFQLKINVNVITLTKRLTLNENQIWVKHTQLSDYGLPSPIKKVILDVFRYNNVLTVY